MARGRDEHIADMISFVWCGLGVNLLPEGETLFVLTLWGLLDEAIEDELRARSIYRRL